MSPYNVLLEDDEPKSLGDWVRNFRVKKIQMRRKLRGGGDLRICAILTTALLNAEHELRRKQQERFNRWLNLQNKFQKDLDNGNSRNPTFRSCASEANIMTSLSSNYEHNEKHRDDEINDLWRSELNSLDEFMKSINNKTQYSSSLTNDGIKATTIIKDGGDNCDINRFNVNNIESSSISAAS